MDIPDQYQSLYDFERTINPDFTYILKPQKLIDVAFVDALLEAAGGREELKTESDWQCFDTIFRMYKSRWSQEWSDFQNSIGEIRKSRGSGGYSESKEIKYVGAIPAHLERIMSIVFPRQAWNKEFVNKLVNRFNIFKVGGEQN